MTACNLENAVLIAASHKTTIRQLNNGEIVAGYAFERGCPVGCGHDLAVPGGERFNGVSFNIGAPFVAILLRLFNDWLQ
jgi:hypothetical protein